MFFFLLCLGLFLYFNVHPKTTGTKEKGKKNTSKTTEIRNKEEKKVVLQMNIIDLIEMQRYFSSKDKKKSNSKEEEEDKEK